MANVKILFIVAGKNFKDVEYFKPREILESAVDADIKVASDIKAGESAIGVDGNEVKIDLTLDDVQVGDFDMIIFVGGPDALQHLDNEKSYKICREALEQNKILAAICVAPAILAKAGVLKGRKATVWSNALNQETIKILRENGCQYEDKKVVLDRNIITANGPAAAEEFGGALKLKIK